MAALGKCLVCLVLRPALLLDNSVSMPLCLIIDRSTVLVLICPLYYTPLCPPEVNAFWMPKRNFVYKNSFFISYLISINYYQCMVLSLTNTSSELCNLYVVLLSLFMINAEFVKFILLNALNIYWNIISLSHFLVQIFIF